jgi:hypothetical protein
MPVLSVTESFTLLVNWFGIIHFTREGSALALGNNKGLFHFPGRQARGEV